MKQEYKKIKSLERKAKHNHQIKYIHAVINCNSRGLGRGNILKIRLAVLRGQYEKEFGGISLIKNIIGHWINEPYRRINHYGISRIREFNKELPF